MRFCYGRIRPLVAMATHIFHRLIMGKVFLFVSSPEPKAHR